MEFAYRDVFDFQRKHPTRASRETALRQMSSEEIRHIARTCGSATGSAYYTRFAEQAAFRELIAPIAEDLERVWQEGKRKKEEDS
jgi:hypothetical protein